jgi:hypothetical protein
MQTQVVAPCTDGQHNFVLDGRKAVFASGFGSPRLVRLGYTCTICWYTDIAEKAVEMLSHLERAKAVQDGLNL